MKSLPDGFTLPGKKTKLMKKYVFVFVILGFLLCSKVFPQQIPMYGQYIFNNTVINPAQAGARDKNQAGILGRYQWLGIDGAPVTYTGFANFRLPQNMGLAVGIYQDNFGPLRDFTLQTDVAYHARLTEKWYLSGGLRLFLSSLSINLTGIDNIDPGDPYFSHDLNSGIHLNLGAGLLAFTENSFIGVAMPQAPRKGILSTNQRLKSFSRHFIAYGGTTFDLTDEFVVTPSTLFKTSDHAPSQLDLNAIFGYNEIFDFGPMIRSNLTEGWFDAVGFLAGFYITENWYFGYMYEYPVNNLNIITKQTHEISLRYLWGSKKKIRIRSPRYFL